MNPANDRKKIVSDPIIEAYKKDIDRSPPRELAPHSRSAVSSVNDNLLSDAINLNVAGVECLCLSLERLIQVKRAAGRPRDFEAIAEQEAIQEERKLVD